MKKIILSIVAIAALVVLPMSVRAQVSAAVTDVPTKARVIRALTLGKTGELNFGTFTSNAAGGTITMLPTSLSAFTRTSSAPTTLALLDVSATQTGNKVASIPTFQVGGEASFTYSITIDNKTDLVGPAGSTAMTLTLGAYSSTGVSTTTGLLSGTFAQATAGTSEFAVGGVLTVGAAQASGDYAGSFGITVAYN